PEHGEADGHARNGCLFDRRLERSARADGIRPGERRELQATLVCLYLSSRRLGFFNASRRKGSPSSLVTCTSSTVVLPCFCAATAFSSASPTSPSFFTSTPSAPMVRASSAQLGFFRFTPSKRLA